MVSFFSECLAENFYQFPWEDQHCVLLPEMMFCRNREVASHLPPSLGGKSVPRYEVFALYMYCISLRWAEPKTDSSCSSWYPSSDEFWKFPLPCPHHCALICLHCYEAWKPMGNSDLFEMVWGSWTWKNID